MSDHQRFGLLARCGPLSLLAGSLVVLPGGLAIRDLRAGLWAVTALIAVLALLVGRQRVPVIRLVPAGIAFGSVAWSNWLLAADRSVEVAAVAGLRVLFFVLPGLVFASFLDPFTVGDHLGQRLRLPARPVLALVAALQRLESLGDDWSELARARRARGLGPGQGPLSRVRYAQEMTFALLVHAIRQAGRLTVAMEARGYSAAAVRGAGRTWAEPADWTRSDTALSVVCCLLAVLPWAVTTITGRLT